MNEFSAIAEALPQLVWISDPGGKVVYFNHPWVEYTGVDVEDAGTNGVVHPDDVDRTRDAWDAALHAQTLFESEYRLRRAYDHSYRWHLARAVPMRSASGAIEYWIGTATDIDAQKRANDNLRFILEATARFSPTLDETQIAQQLADLAVKRHADWSVVYLGTHDRLHVAALAHRDPDKRAQIERFRTEPLPKIAADVERAARDNRKMLVTTPQGPSMNSAMIVPISADGREAVGVGVLVSSWYRYGETDLRIAATVSQRAALAISSAKLIERERRTSEMLRFVTRAGELLFEDFDVAASFERLCHFAVRDIADVAMVLEHVESRGTRILCASGKTLDLDYHASALIGERAARPDLENKFIARLQSGLPYLTRDFDANRVTKDLWEYVTPHVTAMQIESLVTIPIALRGNVYGAVLLASCGQAPPFRESDLSAFGELGRSAAIAIGQAESFSRERRIATALQHAMLPREGGLPVPGDLRFHAVYRPSSDDADIGGDWYDALELPDGSIVITVGDVMGRGLDAAGFMGQLRQAFNVVAMYEADPARMLDAVDELMRFQRAPSIATAFAAVIDRERCTIRYANAGHPYPLLKSNKGLIELRAFGLPLGLRDRGLSERTHLMALDDAHLLVFYTDGLIESTHNLIEGEQRLQRVLVSDAVRFVRNPAEFISTACIGAYAPDDTAVLTVSFDHPRSWSFDAENAQAAHDARGEFIGYLRTQDACGDLMAAELIFGELIGNVVRHAPGPIEIQLEWTAEHPVLHVTDRGTGFDRTPALPDDVLRESGRGLFIIETLSHSLHVEYVPGYGTHAAVTLPITRPAQETGCG